MLFHDREKGTIKKKKTHDDSNLLRSDTHIFAHISLAKASFVVKPDDEGVGSIFFLQRSNVGHMAMNRYVQFLYREGKANNNNNLTY
jgi:hypothetical protein